MEKGKSKYKNLTYIFHKSYQKEFNKLDKAFALIIIEKDDVILMKLNLKTINTDLSKDNSRKNISLECNKL